MPDAPEPRIPQARPPPHARLICAPHRVAHVCHAPSMGTTTVRLDDEDEALLDMLAPEYGGRSSAIRQALRNLATDRQRQVSAPLIPGRMGRRSRPHRRQRRRRDGRPIRPAILDAGFLVSVDRSERTAHTFLTAAARSETALHSTHPVVAQVRRNNACQAHLSALLETITVHPLDDGRPVGQLLAQTNTSDVVDARPVITAVRLGHDTLTGDPADLTTLTSMLGPASPAVHAWP